MVTKPSQMSANIPYADAATRTPGRFRMADPNEYLKSLGLDKFGGSALSSFQNTAIDEVLRGIQQDYMREQQAYNQARDYERNFGAAGLTPIGPSTPQRDFRYSRENAVRDMLGQYFGLGAGEDSFKYRNKLGLANSDLNPMIDALLSQRESLRSGFGTEVRGRGLSPSAQTVTAPALPNVSQLGQNQMMSSYNYRQPAQSGDTRYFKRGDGSYVSQQGSMFRPLRPGTQEYDRAREFEFNVQSRDRSGVWPFNQQTQQPSSKSSPGMPSNRNEGYTSFAPTPTYTSGQQGYGIGVNKPYAARSQTFGRGKNKAFKGF